MWAASLISFAFWFAAVTISQSIKTNRLQQKVRMLDSAIPKRAVGVEKHGCPDRRAVYRCCVISSKEHGKVPGKMTSRSKAWYGMDGKEYEVFNDPDAVTPIQGTLKPLGAARPPDPHGEDSDGNTLWCAIAHTAHGDIPAKVTQDEICYYTHDGRECEAAEFRYVDTAKAVERADILELQEEIASLTKTVQVLEMKVADLVREWS